MKKSFYSAAYSAAYLAAAAALLMANTSAHAGSGFSFEIGGQKIRVDAPRNCSSLDCLSVSSNGSPINLKNINLKAKNSDDDVATNSPRPAPPARPAPAPAPAANNAPPAPPAPVANNAPPAPPAPPAPVANNAPPAPPAPPAPATDASRERITGLPATIDQPPRATNTAPPPAPVANSAPPAPQPAPVAPPAQQAAQPSPTSPLGLWQTADNKGNVRIEQCGTNLCGFGENSNDRILINMKPTSDNKWTGRIHDPESGSNYDSTIALKGPNLLKVQGCAFGGMFCGGQTWQRIS